VVRVVFDTVVFVRALINPHGFAGRLVFEFFDRYQLVLSQPIVEEILEVLQRPELTRKHRALRQSTPAEILRGVERAELVEVISTPPVSRDPKYDKFLATAKAGGATYIVSADKDLLDLREHDGIKIVDVGTFLSILGHP
jgi:putative PIN family toxin of toxin-antitoxin system